MQRGQILVVSGPPAAGKTTLARMFAECSTPSVHLHSDDFWRYIRNGYVEPWLPESDQQNEVVMGAICTTAAEFARGGYEVVLDGVLGPWFLSALTERCPFDEFTVDYLVLLPGLDVVLTNLAQRVGHEFNSVDAATHMHQQFESERSLIADHILDTGSESPEQSLARAQVARAEGRLRLGPRE